jgi:hypothetical protein
MTVKGGNFQQLIDVEDRVLRNNELVEDRVLRNNELVETPLSYRSKTGG